MLSVYARGRGRRRGPSRLEPQRDGAAKWSIVGVRYSLRPPRNKSVGQHCLGRPSTEVSRHQARIVGKSPCVEARRYVVALQLQHMLLSERLALSCRNPCVGIGSLQSFMPRQSYQQWYGLQVGFWFRRRTSPRARLAGCKRVRSHCETDLLGVLASRRKQNPN